MKKIIGLLSLVFLSFTCLSQSKSLKMDWLLSDKKIVISEAKKHGFAVSFRAANIAVVPGKMSINKIDLEADEEQGDSDRKLYYFFDFDKDRLSIYTTYRKVYALQIKKVSTKGNVVKVKIKYRNERFVMLIDLSNGNYKEVRYDKKTKISTMQVHNSVYMYNKN